MRPVFDTGRAYGAFDISTIDPTVLVALVKSTTAITTVGIQTAAQLAAAKREKDAKKKKKAPTSAAAAAAAPVVVAAPAPSSAVPGWAIGLGAVAVVGVVGLILFMPKKSAPVRTP